MKVGRTAGILAILLIGALAAPAAAAQQRPMDGRYSAVPAAELPEQRCPGALTIGFQISGTATHLGRFDGVGTNCTEFTFTTEAVAIWDGITVIEAADGSTLTLHAEGGQDAPVNGVATYSHVNTVVGGTGRFADAEGVMTISGSINFATFEISGSVSGWLSY